jgi:hypothetical protein
MRQDYITSTGIVTIEKNIVYIRRKIGGLNYKLLFEFLVPLVFITRFVFKLSEDPSPGRSMGVFVYGLGSLLTIVPLLYTLFRKSFSNRIPIQKIQAYKIEEDPNGLEIHLILRLNSGRERIISFRKLEHQLEAFVAALAYYEILLEPSVA